MDPDDEALLRPSHVRRGEVKLLVDQKILHGPREVSGSADTLHAAVEDTGKEGTGGARGELRGYVGRAHIDDWRIQRAEGTDSMKQ